MTLISPLSVIGYANVFLIAASILYILHFWLEISILGVCATGLTLIGATGILLYIGLQILASPNNNQHYLNSNTNSIFLFSDLTSVIALFCAITLVIYLIMEWWYNTRSTGAFVIPIVAIALFPHVSAPAYLQPIWQEIIRISTELEVIIGLLLF